MGEVQFTCEEENPLGDRVYKLYSRGFMSAVSVGFVPIKSEPNEKGGYDYVKQELTEVSGVNVPSNPKALQSKEFKGLITDFEKELKQCKTDKVDYKKLAEKRKLRLKLYVKAIKQLRKSIGLKQVKVKNEEKMLQQTVSFVEKSLSNMDKGSKPKANPKAKANPDEAVYVHIDDLKEVVRDLLN